MKISIVQPVLICDRPDINLEHIERLLLRIDSPGDIIVLPEMFNTGFSIEPENAEKQGGVSWNWLQNTAKKMGVAIDGSLMIEENGKYYNRHIFMKPDGTYETYDKKHLFCLSPEPTIITPGTQRKIFNYLDWNIALFTCYDLRFPAWMRNEYHEGNYAYDLLLLGAGWPAVRGNTWNTLLRARAMENQSFVVGVNRVGYDKFQQIHAGDSVVLDFMGEPVLQTVPFEEAFQTVEIHKQSLVEGREKFPVGQDWD